MFSVLKRSKFKKILKSCFIKNLELYLIDFVQMLIVGLWKKYSLLKKRKKKQLLFESLSM